MKMGPLGWPLSNKTASAGEEAENQSPRELRVGVGTGWLQAAVWRFLKKLNGESPDDPATPHLGVSRRDLKAGLEETFVHQCPGQRYSQQPQVETTRVSTDRGMDKQKVAHPYHGDDSALKTKDVLTQAAMRMNPEDKMFSEMSPTQKD